MKKIKFRHSEGFLTFEIPDDAVQFVGYDSNGAEVYDGDELFLTNADGQIAATDKFHLEFLDNFAEELSPDCKLILQSGERDD